MDKAEEQELLARHMAGKYRLGYERVAMYLAGFLFESIINKKVERYFKGDVRGLLRSTLEKKIDALNDKACKADSLFTKDCRSVFSLYFDMSSRTVCEFSENNKERRVQTKIRLHNFRWVRNKVMHGEFDLLKRAKDESPNDLIHYVWRELAEESFNKAFEVWTKRGCHGRVVDCLYEHSADYMVRAVEELDIKEKDCESPFDDRLWMITPLDFENLFNLRRKLASLKNHLTVWLKDTKSNLYTDILTPINTTSAYVWMPLTRINSETQQGILASSVSILATPLDFRVYIDFGGNAPEERELYYKYLKSDEYRKFIQEFSGAEDFFVFDTEWYSFLSEKQTIQGWLANSSNDERIEAAHKYLQWHQQKDRGPITWNRMLHGYIIDKSQLENGDYLDFSMIEDKLKNIICLYESFEAFKKELQ